MQCVTKLLSGGEDFKEMNASLQFQPGERRMVVTLTLLNDLLVEDEEIFHVSISVDDPSITVARENSSVTIMDTDCKTKCYYCGTFCRSIHTYHIQATSQVTVQLVIECTVVLGC